MTFTHSFLLNNSSKLPDVEVRAVTITTTTTKG
jgi:hypothetical protein